MSRSYGFDTEITTLINLTQSQFTARTVYQARKSGADFKDAILSNTIKDGSLYFTITTRDEVHTVTVPIPYKKDGITLIKCNEVERAVCNYFNVPMDKIISYLDVIQSIFMGDYSGLVTTVPIKKTIFIQQLAYAILNNNLSVVVYNLQKAINEIVNKMPLHETAMNSWMMNKRLMIIDPEFDGLTDPAERLAYQVNKNVKYFDRGWTSIGLSDGSLADKNYILTEDIRKCTPFGLSHHNPQRNLYSTLGMKGDELPRIRTETSQKLMDKGITRKGWNWFTAYADVPDNFEDQVVVNSKHANKSIIQERRIQCFGEVLVKVGQKINHGAPLVRCSDGEVECYKVKADSSKVLRIVRGITVVGGRRKVVHNVIVQFKRKLKDGTKVTNMHGNKGIIKLVDNLGYAKDPITGDLVEIDVLANAKTLGKRQNFGQLLEALLNDSNERKETFRPCETPTKTVWTKEGPVVTNGTPVKATPKPTVLADDYIVADMSKVEDQFKTMGFNEDLTWECDTYAGNLTAVCGTVFWGVSKDVEDQLWDYSDTTKTNGKDLRTAGLKFSTVEFKALETRFGKDNAIMREVLTYVQGIESIEETLKMMRSKTGVLPTDIPTKSVFEMVEIDQTGGTMFTKESLINTVADEFHYPNGLVLQLPIQYQTAVGHKRDDNHEGGVVLYEGQYDPEKYSAIYLTDKIYVPAGVLRRSWRHSTGLYGMSEVAVLLNNIIALSNRYREEPENPYRITMLYRTIGNYFARVATMLGTKKGDINNYAMSVRYPYSAKAVAALSNSLPPNTIEIHKDMAKILMVKNGDIVITERFPCLGFMGVRPQKVHITGDPMCKYVIRVSGNSLVSQNLDFDGDVLYIASFHSPEAKAILNKEWSNPNEDCWRYIDWLNNRKGSPRINCLGIKDYNISAFPELTSEKHAEVVSKLTGVKAQTGPVIAMAYNLMRIMENAGVEITRATEAGIEMFIEKAGQSVFEQKHGGQSLHDIVIDAICSADIDILAEEGFDPKISLFICQVIASKAAKLGVHDLCAYHQKQKETGGSNIINRIVRTENKIYFASRSALEGTKLLKALDAEEVDLPSRIFKLTTSGKYNGKRTFLDNQRDATLLANIKDEDLRGVCSKLFKRLDESMGVVTPTINESFGVATSDELMGVVTPITNNWSKWKEQLGVDKVIANPVSKKWPRWRERLWQQI